jgi:hypothetical protein
MINIYSYACNVLIWMGEGKPEQDKEYQPGRLWILYPV